jgi:putative DNA-invertase from lambdoid prophage Rac
MDALYFRVSSDRQTTENQFADLLDAAERDGSGRDWPAIRAQMAAVVYAEERPTQSGGVRTVYKVRPEIQKALAKLCIYVEQGKSGKSGAKRRPLFQQMRMDASVRKFERLLVWKVTRLGRDMREIVATVYELSELGVTVVPIKSPTGPITTMMGKLLWAIQSWYAEFENDERAQSILAGQARARAAGKSIGRPRLIFSRPEIVKMRDAGVTWSAIALQMKIGVATAMRAYESQKQPKKGHSKSIPDTKITR